MVVACQSITNLEEALFLKLPYQFKCDSNRGRYQQFSSDYVKISSII